MISRILRGFAVVGALLTAGLVLTAEPSLAVSAHTLNCRQPGETAVALEPRSIVRAPEPLLDAAGVAAKAYAGFYVEQAVTQAGNTTFVGFFDAEKRLTLASRTGTTGPWTFTQLRDGSGAPVLLDGDTHNYIALTVDAAGSLHVIANVRSSELKYWRSASPATPEKLVFADHLVANVARNAAGARTDDEGYVTYPRFFTAANGTLHLMWRAGWSDAGKTYLYAYNTATSSWSNPLGSNALLNGWTGTNYSPYPDHVRYDAASGYYYLSYTWQESGSAASTSTVNLIRSTDLRTWTSASGAPLTLPILYGDTAALVEDIPEGSGLLNTNVRTGFDLDGRPTVTYVREAASGTVLSIARRDGLNKNWIVSNVSNWTGHNDLSDDSNLTRLMLDSGTVVSGGGMAVSYLCNGEERELVVGYGKFNGQTARVSDVRLAASPLPAALIDTEFPGSGYAITHRTVSTPVSGGTLVLKWEAGAAIANGQNPDPTKFPAGGSTLLLATVSK